MPLLIAVEMEALNISLKVNCKKTEHMLVGDFMQVWPSLTVVEGSTAKANNIR